MTFTSQRHHISSFILTLPTRLLIGLLIVSLSLSPASICEAKKAKSRTKSNKQITKPIPAFPPNKYAAFVIDVASGKVILAENATEQRYPASLTKMMTLYLLFDALKQKKINLDTPLSVSERASKASPTKLGLKAGETLKAEDAILALVTKSANDAAVVVAEALGGTVEQFAIQMTTQAKKLGMRDTVFKNPHGLPDDKQVSTAQDLALLSRALIVDHPQYYHYFSREKFIFRGKRPLRNHNKLLGKVDGLDGLKTGYIRDSGFNLAASALRDDQRIVVIVMGGISSTVRNEKVTQLIELGFKRLQNKQFVEYPSLPPTQGQKENLLQNLLNTLSAVSISNTNNMDAYQGEWGLQIGAYSNAKTAKEIIKKPLIHLQSVHPQAYPFISTTKVRNKKLHQAQILGLDNDSIQNAYTQLKHQGFDPIILMPQEVTTRLTRQQTENR